MHDLLNDPLIGVRTAAGAQQCVTLPGAIAGLLSGDIADFTGLRAHQADPWHVLLVQLAASVMARLPEGTESPADESFWRAGLLDLADGQAAAWHLVVDDVTLPAFMQHPLAAESGISAFSPLARQPDELDVLVTAKNHDVKAARVGDDPEAWLQAVVALQTLSGFLGKGNYGSVRMNGGFGSRCIVSLLTSTDSANRFQEELAVVRSMRDGVLASGIGYRERGVVLTWLTPWSRRTHHHDLATLEPWFVEAVRPLRLRTTEGAVHAWGCTSEARQIGPKAIDSGDVGDPWLPINETDKKKGRSALTVSGAGWTPQRLSDLLLQQSFELTGLQKPRAGIHGPAWFVCSVLVRGQGTTEGLHRAAVPVPAPVLSLIARPEGRNQLAQGAAKLRDDAAEVQKSLRMALMSLASGGPETVNRDNDALSAWTAVCCEPFTRSWSERYFEALWRLADTPLSTVRSDWQAALIADARRTLRNAETRLPAPSSRRWRARVNALGLLNGSLRKKGLLPDLAGTLADSRVDEPESLTYSALEGARL
ncbi:MAG: type I-E CRISPR-associated protein Cse1/CasA [Gammaproteobacteria bacterium]